MMPSGLIHLHHDKIVFKGLSHMLQEAIHHCRISPRQDQRGHLALCWSHSRVCVGIVPHDLSWASRSDARGSPSTSGLTDPTEATFILSHLQHRSLISRVTGGYRRLDSGWEVFFKSGLFFGLGLGVAWTGDQFAPSMTRQEAVDRAFIHFMADLCLLETLDLTYRGYFSALGSRKKGRKQLTFLLNRQILVTPPALPRRFDGDQPQAVVAGNDSPDRCDRNTSVLRAFFSLAWCNQCLINNPPTLAYPKTWIPCHPTLDLFQRDMRGSSRDSRSHNTLSSPFFPVRFHSI